MRRMTRKAAARRPASGRPPGTLPEKTAVPCGGHIDRRTGLRTGSAGPVRVNCRPARTLPPAYGMSGGSALPSFLAPGTHIPDRH
ncbi:hypothetical protein GCM10009863_13660 [Streptomyces axinellae]|uniref:Uncharacterized protein n=1 Tax=Streptomyces axinellae TaxID=552788 RepID=A0ABP6C9S9_9ACTN